MARRRFNQKLRRNSAALIATFLILIVGFTAPLFSTKMFDQSLGQSETIMSNLIINLFSGQFTLSTTYGILLFSLIICYLIILGLYLFNGLGKIYNRYSGYASFLSIVYLFLGFATIAVLNQQNSLSLFGITFTSTVAGWGIYGITLTGILYLLLKRYINSVIRI